MVKEIERKFLVRGNKWRRQAKGVLYRQGYISTNVRRAVRVRIVERKGFLTIKALRRAAVRSEYEYEIPLSDAISLLDELCEYPPIEKKRYKINYKGFIWEIDEFLGENKGLIIAEVELTDENQVVAIPDWVGKEVTDDPRYLNANLVNNPYKAWK